MKYTIYRNIGELLTMSKVAQKDGRHIQEPDLSIISKAALVVHKGCFVWIGENKKIPKEFLKGSKEIDLQGATVLPGFVECHTHSVFAGNRADEFELRNQGMSYQEIAARGGGILSTVKATRAASASELFRLAQARVFNFARQGVTTLEVKSGYALDMKNEFKMLGVIQKLGPIEIVPTYLGAHALPKEFSSAGEYVEDMISRVFPLLKKKKLCERVDIFVEKGFFSPEEADRYLQAAKEFGFQTVIHADQLSLSGGADLALKFSSLSADHLIQIKDEEIQKLAHSKVTCVLLPAADLYMKCAYPPARKLLDAGARVALATDFNPGSSPTQDLSLVGLLARLQMKMTLPEVLAAYTFNAAAALNRQHSVGSIEVGKKANFLSSQLSWKDFFYSAGSQQVHEVFLSGRKLNLKTA